MSPGPLEFHSLHPVRVQRCSHQSEHGKAELAVEFGPLLVSANGLCGSTKLRTQLPLRRPQGLPREPQHFPREYRAVEKSYLRSMQLNV